MLTKKDVIDQFISGVCFSEQVEAKQNESLYRHIPMSWYFEQTKSQKEVKNR